MSFTAFSLGQVVKKGTEYQFLMKWEKGRTYRFLGTILVEDIVAGKNHLLFNTQVPVVVTVKNVQSGIATLLVGTELPAVKGSKVKGVHSTVEIDQHGNIVKGEPGTAAAMFGKWYPKTPIHVGSKWQFSLQHFGPLTGFVPKKKFDVECIFSGFKGSKDKELTEIKISTLEKSKTSMSGSFLVNVSDGLLNEMNILYSVEMPVPPKQPKVRRVAKVSIKRS